MTRKDEAIAIRDAVVAWLPGRAQWAKVGPVRVFDAKIGRFLISYRTPFSPLSPGERGKPSYQRALSRQKCGRQLNLSYGLDVWCGQKVLNLEWDADGHVDLVGFHRGDWVAELLALIAA